MAAVAKSLSPIGRVGKISRFCTNVANQQPCIELSQWESQIFQMLRRCAAASNCTPAIELRVAGGWVRDKLLNRATGDIDIAIQHQTGIQFAIQLEQYVETYTELLPPSFTGPKEYIPSVCTAKCIEAKPANSRHLETAAVFLEEQSLDFVQLRTEQYAELEDSRIPHTIGPATPKEDALRRDFTVNALFYNLHTRQVEDCTGLGLHDLAHAILRTPLQPCVTVRDDPLRALRALRFVCKLGFELCESLRNALSNHELHSLIMRKVSRERVGLEIAQILQSPRVLSGLQLIDEFRLVRAVFGNAFGSEHEQAAAEYKKSLDRLHDAFQLCDEQLQFISTSERDTFERKGCPALVYALLMWDEKHVHSILQEALRRPKDVQMDVRAIMRLSMNLESALQGWGQDSDSKTFMDNEQWTDIAVVLRAGGENLWVPIIIFCSMRMERRGLLGQLARLGLNTNVCGVEPAINGHRVKSELGLKAGPEVGKAIRQLIRLQLRHKRVVWDERQSNNSAKSHIDPSADELISLLKEWDSRSR